MPSSSDKSLEYARFDEGSKGDGSSKNNQASVSSLKGLARNAFDSLKNETKTAIAEAKKEQSQFVEWSSEDLRCLLAEQGVQVRGGDSAPHETLVRICDALFHDSAVSPPPVLSPEDSAKLESAARLIQRTYIASKDGQMERQCDDETNSSSEEGGSSDEADYGDPDQDPTGRLRESTRHWNPDTFRHMSMLRRIQEDDDSNSNDESDEELNVPWRKPSYRYAKRFDASNRPNRDLKPYNWRTITLGRHCTYAGCGEQFDLWDEGTTSEFAQYGSGITNYFKYLKWCCWVMVVLSALHLPVLIINILGGSLQYEANIAASTTFGNLGSADDVYVIKLPGCELGDFANEDSCTISKDRLSVMFAMLDAACTIFVIIAWLWLKKFQSNEAISLNRSTVTASDYTICVRGVPPDTTEDELQTHFQEIVGGEPVAEVNLAFANSKEISLYFKRGKLMRKRYNCVQRIRYEKTRQQNNPEDVASRRDKTHKTLTKLLAERKDLTARIRLADEERVKAIKNSDNSKVIQAFVTFQTERQFIKAISAYNHMSWVRSVGCCYPKHLMLKNHRLGVAQAPEPSTILFENLEYSSSSRFFRQCLTAVVALMAVCISIVFTFLARDFQGKTLAATSKACPGGYYGLDVQAQRDVVEQDIDLAHCYCATLGISEQWGVNLCSDYLSMTLKSSATSYGAGLCVVFLNIMFTILFDRSGTFEKHESLEAMERSNMTRVFLLKLVNTGILVLLYNWLWLQRLIKIRLDHAPDFDVEWYATGGVSLIIVMTLNAFTPHIGPVVRYLLHRSKVRRLEKNLTKDLDTKDSYRIFYTQEDLNSYVGSSAKFCLNYRYTQGLCTFYICWMYALSIPVLLIIGALSFFISYWVDKWLFCSFYRTPPMYSDSMGKKCTNLIGLCVALHLIISMWCLGTKDKIFNGLDWSFADGDNPPDIDMGVLTLLIRKAIGKRHLIILFGLLLLYGAGHLLSRFSLGIGSGLLKSFRCMFCQASSSQTTKLKATMNTVQIDYNTAVSRGVIKGLASYNILKNPKYQEAFGISPEFADSHKRLSAIRGLNTKEGGMV